MGGVSSLVRVEELDNHALVAHEEVPPRAHGVVSRINADHPRALWNGSEWRLATFAEEIRHRYGSGWSADPPTRAGLWLFVGDRDYGETMWDYRYPVPRRELLLVTVSEAPPSVGGLIATAYERSVPRLPYDSDLRYRSGYLGLWKFAGDIIGSPLDACGNACADAAGRCSRSGGVCAALLACGMASTTENNE